MAKQRRTPPRHARRKTKAARPKTRPRRDRRAKPSLQRQVPPDRVERDVHAEAIAAYETGLRALQHKQYAEAAQRLRSVIENFPDEKELHERAQLYLNVCERQVVPPDSTPRTFDERLYAATLGINAGAFDDALKRLDALAAESPDNDYVHYMLAVVHAQRSDVERAWPHLQRAIELNAENRNLARQDADLELLRRDPQFRQIVDRPTAGRRDRRGAHRPRPVR